MNITENSLLFEWHLVLAVFVAYVAHHERSGIGFCLFDRAPCMAQICLPLGRIEERKGNDVCVDHL